jgi:hypothetical protein
MVAHLEEQQKGMMLTMARPSTLSTREHGCYACCYGWDVHAHHSSEHCGCAHSARYLIVSHLFYNGFAAPQTLQLPGAAGVLLLSGLGSASALPAWGHAH